MRLEKHRITFVALCASSILVLAACGGGSTEATAEAPAEATAATAATEPATAATEPATAATAATEPVVDDKADCVAEASAAVEAAKAPLTFGTPVDSVDASLAEGKTLYVIVTSMQSPLHETIARGIEAAATAAGVKTVLYDGQFSPDKYNDGVRQALAQNADAIILQSVAREIVSGPIEEAVEKGVIVVDLWNGGLTQPLDGFFAHVTSDFVQEGALMANYVLAESGCEANAVTYTASQYVLLLEMSQGIKEVFDRLCPECGLEISEVNTGTLATSVGPQVVADLTRDPTINWLIPQFDAAAQPMVPAIKTAGLEDRVKLISHDGVEVNMDWVRNQDVQVMDAAFPDPDYVGWVLMDQTLRGLAGAEPAVLPIPARIFDSSNIPPAGEELHANFGDYKTAFTKLWNVG